MGGRLLPVLAAAAATLAFPGAASAELRFRDCGETRCARLSVPLDHSGGVSGTLRLVVRRHRAEDPPRRGVTLVLQGGPGVKGPDEPPYEWAYRTPSNDVVTFDVRGSGATAVRCRDLEAASTTDAGREAAACAALLGERRGVFRAADTVEDIELVRAELGAERLTIVGAGNGSYVAQRYLLRYPQRVERLVLQDVVDAAGVDPLYRDSVAAVPRVLAAACRRGCGRFTRDPVVDTARLVARLAGDPLRGTIVGPGGTRRAATLTRQELLFTLMAGDSDLISRPEYPAAVVSALRGDPAPLLRLKRRATLAGRALVPRFVSPAAEAAATCEEVRFPWSWHASPAERDEAAYDAERAMDPSQASPFDPGTLVRSDLMRLCRRWPTASPGPPAEPDAMPDVPVLMLANPGSVRHPVETARRAATRYARAQVLVTPEVPWLDECVDRAVGRFVRGRPVQDRCPRGEPPFTAYPPDPRSLRELAPVPGVPGRRGRLLNAVGASIGDLADNVYARLFVDPLAFNLEDEFRFEGGGLRGGSFVLGEDLFRVTRYEYVPGVRLTGRWGAVDDADDPPLRIDGPGRLDGRVRMEQIEEGPFLRVRGRIAGRPVRARVRIRSVLVDVLVEEEGGSFGPSAALARDSALPWPACAAQLSSSPSRQRGWPSPLRLTRRCASSAAAATASPARG